MLRLPIRQRKQSRRLEGIKSSGQQRKAAFSPRSSPLSLPSNAGHSTTSSSFRALFRLLLVPCDRGLLLLFVTRLRKYGRFRRYPAKRNKKTHRHVDPRSVYPLRSVILYFPPLAV